MGSTPLAISFDKIDGFIKIYDGIRYYFVICMMKFVIGLNIS